MQGFSSPKMSTSLHRLDGYCIKAYNTNHRTREKRVFSFGLRRTYAALCPKRRMPSGLKLCWRMANFPERLNETARRALAEAGYADLEQLSNLAETDLIDLLGFGPSELMLVKEALAEQGLSFSDQPQGAMSSPRTVSAEDE